jgi:transcriptional repressor of cell division inhibition gene dicB
MDKQKAIELAGSAKALADIFRITESAVSQWDDEIPELRVLQLEKLRPEWFQAKEAA